MKSQAERRLHPTRSSRLARTRTGAVMALALLWLFGLPTPRPASAQCTQVDQTVTCDADDGDGFAAAPGEDGLTITILQGVTVSNAGDVFRINDANDVTINDSTPPGAPGTVLVTGNGSAGIRGGDENTIVNRGEIVIQGAGNSASDPSLGIDVGDQPAIDNRNTITVDAANSVGVRAGDLLSRDGSGYLYSWGTIELAPGASGSVGIQVGQGWTTRTDSSGTPSLANAGSGRIAVDAANSRGMVAGDNSLADNRGVITVTGSGSVGISVGGNDGQQAPDFAAVDNWGSIAGDDDTGPLIELNDLAAGGGAENLVRNRAAGSITAETPRTAIAGSPVADRIENEGTISGVVRLGDGDDTFVHYPSARYTADIAGSSHSASIDGEGGNNTFVLGAGGGPGSFALDQIQLSSFQRLQIESGGIWTFTGDGSSAPFATTEVETGATLEWSGTQTATLPGDLSFADGSTLRVVHDSASWASPLRVTGTARFGGSLSFTTADDLDTLVDGTVIPLVHAAGGVDPRSSFARVLGGTAVVRIEPRFEPQDLALVLRVLAFAQAASSPNRVAIAGQLDALAGGGAGSPYQPLLSDLRRMDDASYQHALDQLHPEAYDAQASATLAFGDRFTQLMFERPHRCIAAPGQKRRDPVTNRPCRVRRWEPWFVPYGQIRKRDGENGHVSFRNNGGGLVLGVDRRMGEHFMAVASLGTARGVLRVDDVGKGRLSTIDLGLAAGYTRGPLRLQAAASYGRGWHQSYRNIAIPGYSRTAEGQFDSHRIGLRLRGDYGFELRGWRIAPQTSLDYTALLQSSFEESGAGELSLVVGSRSDSIVTLRAGLDVSTRYHKTAYWTGFLEMADGVWRPSFSLGWRQLLAGSERPIGARLIGAPAGTQRLTVEGDDADRGFEIGAGLDFTPRAADRLTVGVRYDTFLWTGVSSHELRADLRLSF